MISAFLPCDAAKKFPAPNTEPIIAVGVVLCGLDAHIYRQAGLCKPCDKGASRLHLHAGERPKTSEEQARQVITPGNCRTSMHRPVNELATIECQILILKESRSTVGAEQKHDNRHAVSLSQGHDNTYSYSTIANT
jgi:hypothetical protein